MSPAMTSNNSDYHGDYCDPRTDDEHMADVANATIGRLLDLNPEMENLGDQIGILTEGADRKGLSQEGTMLRHMHLELQLIQRRLPEIADAVLRECRDDRAP